MAVACDRRRRGRRPDSCFEYSGLPCRGEVGQARTAQASQSRRAIRVTVASAAFRTRRGGSRGWVPGVESEQADRPQAVSPFSRPVRRVAMEGKRWTTGKPWKTEWA